MPHVVDHNPRPTNPGEVAHGRLRSARVLLAGLGNIGSYLAMLLAPLVSFVRLVDRGVIERRNAQNQLYGPDLEGLAKVDAIAARVERLAPKLTVERRVADLEDLPLGDFADVDIGLAGLDSLRARQVLSERLYPLGIPLIDGAVGDPMLARVQVLLPGHSCLECSWGKGHYRQLAAEYPCNPGESAEAPRTLSPGCGGAVTAGMMVAQCMRLFGAAPPSESYEINGDLLAGRFLTARRRLNDRCRYRHGQASRAIRLMSVQRPFAEATIGDLIVAAERAFGRQEVQFEFRRGILPGNLFGEQLCAGLEQFRRIQHRRLEEFGLTPRDRVVVHANGRPHAAHITLGTTDRRQI